MPADLQPQAPTTILRRHRAQRASPSSTLAALNPPILLDGSTRGVKFLVVFAKADEPLRAWGLRSTIGGPGGACLLAERARPGRRVAG